METQGLDSKTGDWLQSQCLWQADDLGHVAQPSEFPHPSLTGKVRVRAYPKQTIPGTQENATNIITKIIR